MIVIQCEETGVFY